MEKTPQFYMFRSLIWNTFPRELMPAMLMLEKRAIDRVLDEATDILLKAGKLRFADFAGLIPGYVKEFIPPYMDSWLNLAWICNQ